MISSTKNALLSAACLLALSATAQAADPFSAEQKEALNATIKEYILANPEVLAESLSTFQKKQQDGMAGKFKQNFEENKAELMDGGSPIAGNPKGDVTVIEFFDYNCGYCKKAIPDITKLLEEDKKVKIVFKEYPILSPKSHEAAAWAIAANKQGKYIEFHTALMSHQGSVDDAALESVAKKVGLDIDKLRKDKDDPKIKELLEKDIALAGKLGIRGTPAFIVGDKLNPGYMGYEGLKAAVDEARKNKKQ